jgi:Holliday junction resolvase RusA-like endonuclease
VLDGMNKVVYEDDGQIVTLHCTKVYGEPFVEVLIKESE